MRYEIRWANGSWRVFDTLHYTTVELCATQAETERAVDTLNALNALNARRRA